MTLWLALALQAAASPATAPEATGPDIVVDRYAGCGPRFAKTYIAPLGQPFRTDGRTDPMGVWFAQADADHDGRLTVAELQADGDHFFATLDKDGSGEIDPQEMSDYENFTAPEIKLYQPGQDRRGHDRQERRELKAAARQRADYEAPYGAGQWASLNIPEPVNSADFDINRGVSKAELEQAAARRFPLLDTAGRGYLSYDTLPKSPAQKEIDACRAAIDKKKR
jgi:hypothetical protein